MTNRAKRLEALLTDTFAPERLKIVDESASHAGHAGHSGAGESHFYVEIISSKFEGLSRVAAQRLVNEALKDEFESGLHALRMKTGVPA